MADKWGQTPLHFALKDAFHGCLEVVKMLLTGMTEFAKGIHPTMLTRRPGQTNGVDKYR